MITLVICFLRNQTYKKRHTQSCKSDLENNYSTQLVTLLQLVFSFDYIVRF